jgi:hypothetical protein
VVHHLLEAVVRGLVLVGGGHDIPGDAPARHVIERIEETRDVKGMVVGRRHRQRKADVGGRFRHQGNHRRHVMARPLGAVAHVRVMTAAEIFRRPAGVAEEQHVHDAALRDPGDLFVEVGRAVVVVADPGAGHAPEIIGVKERQIGGEVDGLRL